MTQGDTSRRSNAPWYLLWSAMLVLSMTQAVIFPPLFSGTTNLCIGSLLALVAAGQIVLKKSRLAPRRASLSAVLLLTFCMAQLVHFAVSRAPVPPKRGVDFSAYYLGAKVISQDPVGNIYELPKLADGRTNLNTEMPPDSPWSGAARRYQVPYSAPYIYPPLFAILMKPLAHLPFAWAYLVWNLVTVLLVMVSAGLALDLAGVTVDRQLALILGVGLFSYYPLLEHLFVGQIGGLILFLFTGGAWLLSRRRVGVSALCFALATAIKLTPALALPILIFHRRWRWLTAYAVWMGVLLAFSVWEAGWSTHIVFWRDVLPSISKGVPVCQNLSITAFIQELYLGRVPLAQSPSLTIPPHSGTVSKAIAMFVYVLMLVRFYRRRHEGELMRDLALVALLALVVSPISWVHHYTLALLPFVYLWAQQVKESVQRKHKLLLILFLLLSTNVIEFIQFSATNPLLQLMLATIVPGLTIALIYEALAPQPEVYPSASTQLP